MAEREGTARFRKRKNSSKKIIEELKKKVQDSSQITKGLKKYSKEIKLKFLKERKYPFVKNISKELGEKIQDAEQREKELHNYQKELTGRNKVKKIIIPFIFLLAIFSLFFFFSYIQPRFTGFVSFNPLDTRVIGYEYLNNLGEVVSEATGTVVHIWNSQDDYYFNKTSGIQFTNHFQEYWTHNIFCGGFKNTSNDWEYDCNDELPFNWNIASDNLTYVNYTGWRTVTRSGKEVRGAIRYHLKTDDKNLTIQFSINNTGTSDINTDIGFAWRVNEINVSGDIANDKIIINESEYWLNNSIDLTFANMTQGYYEIKDIDKMQYLWLMWNNNLNYAVRVRNQSNQFNAPVTLAINAGSLAIGQEKTTEMFWNDPNITSITLPGAMDIGLAPLDNSTFVMAYINYSTGKVTFEVWNTSGVKQFSAKNVPNHNAWNLDPNTSRVSVVALNKTDFVIGWTNRSGTNASEYAMGFNRSGSMTWNATWYDGSIGQYHDIRLTKFPNPNDMIAYCYVDSVEGDADVRFFNATTGVAVSAGGNTTEVSANAASAPLKNLSNIIDCNVINESALALLEHDAGADDDITFHMINKVGTEYVADTDLNTNVSNSADNAQVAVASIGNNSVFVWSNFTGISMAMRTFANGVVYGTTTIEPYAVTTGVSKVHYNQTMLATATVFNRDTNDDNFVVIWYNFTTNDIVAKVYNRTGNLTKGTFVIEDRPSATPNLMYAVGKDGASNQSLCTGTWVIAYTNNSNSTIIRTFWYNGSEWNGLCEVGGGADLIKPNIEIVYPDTNNTNWTINTLDINYTRSDTGGLFNCWYSNDTNLVNNTLGTTCENITSVVWSDGKHNVTIYANDTSGNVNQNRTSFTIDTTKPAVYVTYPDTNNSNWTMNTLDINYTRSDWYGLTNCWYSNDSNLKNTSLGTTCDNVTTIVWTDAKHNVTIYANDTFGNVNQSRLSFTIDTTKPAVYIDFPSNNTNWTDSGLDINFTRSDWNGLTNCWYTNDSNLKNTSLATCENITGVTWTDAKHNVTIYANDTAGNVNQSRISFNIDTTKPAVYITFPDVNNTNSSDSGMDVNYTRSDFYGLFNCWYTNDSNLKNTSLATCENITSVTWSDVKHNVTVYVNDSAGNVNQSRISFTTDTVKPDVNITEPLNNTNWSDSGLDINYTRGNDVQACWYTNDTNLINLTLASCANLTGITWSDAKHNVTIYVNDSAGNINLSRISFTIDTVKPDVEITYPLNNSVLSDAGADVNYTRSDSVSGLFNCWYSNDSYLANTSLANCINLTTITWIEGAHNVTIWANDSAGNINRSRVNFSVLLDTPPEVTDVFNNTESIKAIATTLNAGPSATYIEINFSAYDANGDLADTTAAINASYISGTESRHNTTCSRYEITGDLTSANYTCNLTMWWWDSAGVWNINVSISDDNGNSASNVTKNFSVGATLGFEIGPLNLTWNNVGAGATNRTSNNDPLVLNNTGNQEIGISSGNISINATSLKGEIDSTKALWGSNFSVDFQTGGTTCAGAACVECAGSNMTTSHYANITTANLTKGNFTADNRINGQEELYFCLRIAGTDLTEQPYSTRNQGVWTIKILLVAFIPAAKKKNRKKQKTIKDDKLLEAFNLIAEELKQEYSLNKKELLQIIIEKLKNNYKISRKEILEAISNQEIEIPISIFSKELGCLEAIAKYMKENLNMNYSEIARQLGRDERTIWTSYKKAKEKEKLPFIIKQETMLMSISVFRNEKLTILESVILYLKEKGMKYSEIGKLLNRNQRNIWTTYSRLIKK